jgi:hypothetical protein
MKKIIIAAAVILLVCIGFFAGYALNTQSNTDLDLPENLAITNVDYGVTDSKALLSIMVNNTGISNVNIVKLLLNNIKQSSVSPTLPTTLEPDSGVLLYTTIDVTEAEYQNDTLNIDVVTSKGNTFSEVFTPPPPSEIPFEGSSSVTITNINFVAGTPNSIALTIRNTGTKSVTITQVKVNNAVVASLPASLTLAVGQTSDPNAMSLAVAWVAGNPYKVDLYDSSAQVIGSYQANAAGS